MPRAAAFFDLDRTLMAGSSGMAWVRASYDAKLISRAQMLRWARDGLVFRLRGSTDETTKAAMDQISDVLKGTSGRDLERLGPQVLAGVLPRIYPEMLAEVHSHQDAGRPTFIVSAAGNDLVEQVARVLGMEGGIGTRYELDGDGPLHRQARRPVHVRRRQARGNRRASPSRTTSTSPSRGRTPTRPRTCRCCARSATPSS